MHLVQCWILITRIEHYRVSILDENQNQNQNQKNNNPT